MDPLVLIMLIVGIAVGIDESGDLVGLIVGFDNVGNLVGVFVGIEVVGADELGAEVMGA